MRNRARLLLYVAMATLVGGALSSCGVTMQEKHYFASVDQATGQTINVYRLTVSGGAGMANARYIAGYYDERAVDLFFNEVRASSLDSTSSNATAPSIFNVACAGSDVTACASERDRRLAMVPIGEAGAADKGAFVLILSSNADAIAGTIGQFAETDANMQAALYLATRDTHQAAARLTAADNIIDRSRSATYAELKALFDALPTGAAATPTTREQAYLAILQATAAGLDRGTAPTFANMDEARTWFEARQRIQP